MKHKGIASTVVGLGIAAGVWAVQSGPCLRLQGRLATDDVVVSRGKMYVPVSMLADALHLQVRATGDGCDLIGTDADATPRDLNVPQERGGYRLEMEGVGRAPEYRANYGYYDFSATAAHGKELVVVTLRLTNGTGAAQSIDLANGRDTLLSDARYRSVRALRGTNGRVLGGTLSLLPGDVADFALKFEVPVGFRPDRLVVSIQNAFDRVPIDFRFSLGR